MTSQSKLLIIASAALLLSACNTSNPQATPTPTSIPEQPVATPTEAMNEAATKLMTNATVTVPDTDFTVSISSETGPTVEYGDRDTDPEAGFGTVTILTQYTVMMEDGNIATILAVNSGGSGTFEYLAVFEPGEASWQMTASAPLGDRIQIDDLTTEGDTITVDYKEHGPDQAMVDAPNTPVSKTFTYANSTLTEVQ